MHLSRSLLLAAIAVAALVKFASAQTVTVSIAVTTNSTPPVGVPAHIYRKSASTDEKLVTDTDDDGKAMVSEVICSADVQYRAEALALIRFPRGRQRWEPCRLTGQIVFQIAASGVSRMTETFLSGKIPEGWVVPQGYEPVFANLRTAVDEEQWGAAAKLSSQLADQYRSAGYRDEASTFAEIALAGTAGYATTQFPNADDHSVEALLKPKNPKAAFNSEILMSRYAKQAVAEFQTSCGLRTDGIVGWETMGCLPGGADYTLPSVATVPFQNLVIKPNS